MTTVVRIILHSINLKVFQSQLICMAMYITDVVQSLLIPTFCEGLKSIIYVAEGDNSGKSDEQERRREKNLKAT